MQNALYVRDFFGPLALKRTALIKMRTGSKTCPH